MKTMKDFKGTQGEFVYRNTGYTRLADGSITGQTYAVLVDDGKTSPFYQKNVVRIKSRDHSITDDPLNSYAPSAEEAEANARLFANSKRVLAELIHLVRLLEPLEKEGKLDVPGLATLNGARQAINDSL